MGGRSGRRSAAAAREGPVGQPAGAPARTSATAEALAGLPSTWTVLHARQQPERRRRPVDHVVVGPGGVFVIVEPPWSGRVEIRGGVLRRHGRRGARTVHETAAAAEAVARILPGLGHKLVRPVLCVDSARRLSGVSGGVLLCSPDNVVELLGSRSALVDEVTAQQLVAELDRTLQPVGPHRRQGPWTPSRTGHWARAVRDVVVVVAALSIVALLVLNFDAVRRAVERTLTTSSSELGSPVGLAQGEDHPRLTVTAQRVTDVHPRPGVASSPRSRLVGVQLRLRNRGEGVLRLDPGAAVTLRPVLGRSYPAVPVRAAIREGRLLPERVRVPAGGSARGWVVFRVPEEAAFDQVSVRFGAERDDVARWRLPAEPPERA